MLNGKKNEDKLYRDLHKSEERISELNQKIVVATNERMDALQQMSSMRGQITDLKSQLIAIVANLNEYLTARRLSHRKSKCPLPRLKKSRICHHSHLSLYRQRPLSLP